MSGAADPRSPGVFERVDMATENTAENIRGSIAPADRTADAATVTLVDVRIAVNHSPREVTVEVPDDERDDVNTRIEAALSGDADVLWLVDKRGRRVGVPSEKIAYIEVGAADGDRRIGFGG